MSLASLASSLFSSTNESRSEVMITGLAPVTEEPQESFVFQYFPATIADSKQINHQRKEVPGGTLPIYQWINSGERLISFTAFFAADVDLMAQGAQKAGEIYDRLRNEGLTRRSVDVRTAIAYLRTYMLPRYIDGRGSPATQAPRKMRLTIPRSGIGLNGGAGVGTVMPDSMYCIMTQCEVTYDAFFPSGMPRVAQVQLSFAQIGQIGGQVQFPQTALDILPQITNTGGGSQGIGLNIAGALGAAGSLFSGGSGNAAQTLGSLQPYTVAPRKLKG